MSDSDIEDDEGEGPLLNNPKKSEVRLSDSAEDKVVCEDEEHGKRVGKGKVVKIPDVAYVT